MSDVGQLERKTQERVVQLFQDSLSFDYLGNWEYRADNSNIEVDLLAQNLRARGYREVLVNKAIAELKKAAALGGGRDLYEANLGVYGLLRYGVKVKAGMGEQFETVWLIDWSQPAGEPFRGGRRGHGAGALRQAPRRRAVRQRHRARARWSSSVPRWRWPRVSGRRSVTSGLSSSVRSSVRCSW